MSHHDDAWWRHPRMRLRHDAHLWIRPDVSRWMRPGFDPADVFPTLARDRAQAEAARQRARAAEDAAFDAFIERERRVLAAIRAELNEIKAELARRRRLAETKYSPSQPRVPAGNPRGGQWTDRGGGQGLGQRTSLARPMGSVELGNVSGSSELGDLFQIKPDDTRVDGVRLAGDSLDGSGKDQGTPSSDPPAIRKEKPKTSTERTGFMRAASDWLARNTGLAGDTYTGAMNNVEWLNDRRAVIQAGRDPARLSKSCKKVLVHVGQVTTITISSSRRRQSAGVLREAKPAIRRMLSAFHG